MRIPKFFSRRGHIKRIDSMLILRLSLILILVQKTLLLHVWLRLRVVLTDLVFGKGKRLHLEKA
jgi:succinate dehydrogenase hydrophobic anchor subunit